MERKHQVNDDLLDRALKQYGAGEPRDGLEERILANLQIERSRMTARTWRWWPVMVAVASMLLIGTAVWLKTKARPARSAIVITGVATVPAAKEIRSALGNEVRVATASRPHRRERRVVAAVARLEHFPSPQPLSEQEELLARYIEQYPHEAVVVARAQTELMKEMIEREPAPESAVSADSQQENR
jgi:hypothetical protein